MFDPLCTLHYSARQKATQAKQKLEQKEPQEVRKLRSGPLFSIYAFIEFVSLAKLDGIMRCTIQNIP